MGSLTLNWWVHLRFGRTFNNIRTLQGATNGLRWVASRLIGGCICDSDAHSITFERCRVQQTSNSKRTTPYGNEMVDLYMDV